VAADCIRGFYYDLKCGRHMAKFGCGSGDVAA
jgi:hypothetical protein